MTRWPVTAWPVASDTTHPDATTVRYSQVLVDTQCSPSSARLAPWPGPHMDHYSEIFSWNLRMISYSLLPSRMPDDAAGIRGAGLVQIETIMHE